MKSIVRDKKKTSEIILKSDITVQIPNDVPIPELLRVISCRAVVGLKSFFAASCAGKCLRSEESHPERGREKPVLLRQTDRWARCTHIGRVQLGEVNIYL